MAWYLGKTIRESFATGETGEAFAALRRKIDGVDATFAPTFSGSDGAYEAVYAPTVTGVHTSSWQGSISGAVVTFTWDVVTAAQADPLAASVADYARDTLGGRVALLGAGASVVTSPVSADGETMTLTQGDDHTVASGQPIAHTEPVGGPSWPILTAATPRLVITNRVNASMIDQTGTVVTATGTAKSVRFELTAAQTGALHVGDPAYYFAVVVTLADASERTLVRGAVAVERDARP